MRHSHTRTMPGRTLSSGNKYTKSDARSQDMRHEKNCHPVARGRGGPQGRSLCNPLLRIVSLSLSSESETVSVSVSVTVSVSVSVYIAFASFCLGMFYVCLGLLGICLSLLRVCLGLLCNAVEWLMQTCRDATDRVPTSGTARPTAYHPTTPAHRPARHGTARCGARHLMPLR